MRQRPHLLALAAGLALGVAASCAGGKPPAPPTGQCTGAQCRAPPCCGQDCGADGGCCAGTVCSASNKCVPQVCAACGAAGCSYEPSTCAGSCTKPECCLADCTADAGCCPGTRCQLSASGVQRCFPTGCDACVGMRPFCKTDAQCGVTCEKPPSCGNTCVGPAECGAGATCKNFTTGPLCVPAVFDAECQKCALGCLFDTPGCAVKCVEPDAGTVDAGPPPALDAGTCLACCSPCSTDGGLPCCAGSFCAVGVDGQGKCEPLQCRQCAHGCDYACPGGA